MEQHDRFIQEHGLLGGSFFSARTGENIVKFFYKVRYISSRFILSFHLLSAMTTTIILRLIISLFQTATDALGVKMTDYELGFYDKVLTAYIAPSSSDETAQLSRVRGEDRTTFADEIEEEDRKLEEAKSKRSHCSIS
jgi:hypothetical protein